VDAVASAAAQTTLRWDTVLDTSPQDAQRRAAPLMTASYAQQVKAARVAVPGASWAQLKTHHGWCSTTARPDSDPHPPDTATTASRGVYVTQTCRGGDGWQQPATSWLVQEQLSRQGGVWRVALMVVRPEPGAGVAP